MVRSTRCFVSADGTEPMMVTRPPSTMVLTSRFASAGSDREARSIWVWMVASSTAAVSPAGSGGSEGRVDVAVGVGDGVGDCTASGPEGTVCCASKVESIGSYGRLVTKRARNVASAAAPMTLSATTPSRDPVRRPGRPELRDCREVEMTTRFLSCRCMSCDT